MEIEITGTEKKLFSCVDSEGLIGNEDTQYSLFQKFYYMSFISFYKQAP